MSQYYCPTCSHELEEQSGCGSISYFCDTCKKLVSRTKILTEEEMKAGKGKEEEK